MENLPEITKAFFDENKFLSNEREFAAFFIRPDGVPVYHLSNFDHDINDSSVGALLGGVWQAAKTLAAFLPNENNNEEFRLSFDTTSKGIYVLPVRVGEDEYFLGLIYHAEVNPGLIKSKLRNFVNRFQNFIEEKKNSNANINETSNDKESALFSNITDSEMDDLFSF